MNDNNSQWLCDRCEHPVQETSGHCPECGALFADDVFCSWHHSHEALGICVICSQPFCQRCGGWVAGKFLCDPHAGYEIFEGMARVYSDTDFVRVQFAMKCLEQAGLRPFQISRKNYPASGFGFRNLAHQGGDPHAVYEWKILLAFSEVLKGEGVLKDLDFISTEKE